jgi:hypothetical protein
MTFLNPYEAPLTIQAPAPVNSADGNRARWFAAVSYVLSGVLFAMFSVAALLAGFMYVLGGPYWIAGTSLFVALTLAVVSLVLAIRGVLSLISR